MSESPSPYQAGLQQFISRHIQSVEQLEILCLLAEDSARRWQPSEVFRQIQSSEKSISDCLTKFVREGFFRESEGLFQFAPVNPALGESVAELARAYRERRVSVVEMIYRKPEDPIQHFADAFRLRKDK